MGISTAKTLIIGATLLFAIQMIIAGSAAPEGQAINRVSDLGVIEQSRPWFISALLLGGISTYIYLRFYMEKRFLVSSLVRGLIIGAVVLQLLFAFVPADPDRELFNVLHLGSVLVWAHLLGMAITLFTLNNKPNLPKDISSIYFLIGMGFVYALGLIAIASFEDIVWVQIVVFISVLYWLNRLSFAGNSGGTR